MIARAAAFLLLLYGLGFALFSVTLAAPAEADAPKAQAIVVITGGPGRIERDRVERPAHDQGVAGPPGALAGQPEPVAIAASGGEHEPQRERGPPHRGRM